MGGAELTASSLIRRLRGGRGSGGGTGTAAAADSDGGEPMAVPGRVADSS
jgi:hypothetical protein